MTKSKLLIGLNKISNRISKSMGILNKLKRFIPIKTKILIYNSLVLSHLNFGILAWVFNVLDSQSY